jgi:hypothetical protein
VEGHVQLDLNFPDFQGQLFNLDVNWLRPVFKTFKKLSGMSWVEVYADHGLKWEEIKSMKGKYTIRLSRQCRAVVVREGEFMCFRAIHTDHDGAYGKK